MSVYLDCNASTPLDPRVQEEVLYSFEEEIGNPGSRTHEFGLHAKQSIQKARDQVAAVVKASREEVIFTSGATESNNIAILGLVDAGEKSGRRHIISTQIEHKAVLEPLQLLSRRGFEITFLEPNPAGWIEPGQVQSALREDTLMVTVMHVNNETGVVQPITEIAELLKGNNAFFHVDAAQGFGKDIPTLQNSRVDLISISAHKIYGPKGVGALVVRRRGYNRIPLSPIMVGGGQELGIRPGTLPTALIVGLGKASELALSESHKRAKKCSVFRNKVLETISAFNPIFNGDQQRTLSHVVNLSIPGLDSEAVMVSLKGLIAISNGSACTSASYEPSHVLKAMKLDDDVIKGALRISWCHLTENPDWEKIQRTLHQLLN